jgi:hypothetical protein
MSEKYILPQEIWAKWEDPNHDCLRQAVLVFGGNTNKEAIVESFKDVSLLFQEGEATSLIGGVMNLTTKRMIFLPGNQIPHPHLIQSTYESLSRISGIRNDLSVSLTDNTGATANFKFPSPKTLYQFFNLLRSLAEATRLSSKAYAKEIYKIVTEPEHDATPFSLIEFDLGEVKEKNPEIYAPKAVKSSEDNLNVVADPLINLITPIKHVIDYCNHLHFDIHIKLRILFFIALITFILKFIPALPLTALIIICVQLYFVWRNIKNDDKNDFEEISISTSWVNGTEKNQIEGYAESRKFFRDWFMWEDSKKSTVLLSVCLCVFFGWTVLPPKIYYALCLTTYGLFLVRPLLKSSVIPDIINGFWFAT